MRIPFCLAIAALCVLYAAANPIVVTNQGEQAIESEELPKEPTNEEPKEVGKGTPVEVEAAGIAQEETPGVFAGGASKPAEEKRLKETGRQSTDDDDDDDDDDLGLDLEDDDDDDDAADDDDDDYFDGIFDDILGDDDDDDDDDEDDEEPAAAAPVQPVAAPEDAIEAANAAEEAAEETVDQETYTEPVGADSLIDKDPDADNVVQNTVQEPVVVQPVPAVEDEAAEEDDDEDEDDDDDDDEGDLADLADDDDDDDDDEDDAADDDDDDDDDEDDLEDVIEAKRSRALESAQPRIPSVYIAKYNRFVDTIIDRINAILGKSYDPVRVKLQRKSPSKKTKTNGTKGKRKSTKGKKPRRPADRHQAATNKMGEIELARSGNGSDHRPAFVLISKAGVSHREEYDVETRAKTKKTKTKTKTKGGATKKTGQKARATLFGLSSLRRDGDVTVTTNADRTTVKSDFILGPLELRVEKEFERQLKSATAITAEMRGRLNLRILPGGAATLHSIKVLQPKQVRVESADNHEKTKEFVWNRSSRIAKVVATKLAAAAKSMLQPAPGA